MSSPTSDRAHLLDAFNHQSQLLDATVVLFEQAVAEQLQLSISHVHVANLLRLTGPMTAGQIAELTGLTTGSVTSMVDRLERAGYVRRESDPHDRRRVVVQAEADAMERNVGPFYESLAQASAALIASYTDAELAFLVDHLTRSNALVLEEAVKLRRVAAQGNNATGGEELSGNKIAVPLEGVQKGHLVFTTGATRLNLRGDTSQNDLFRAQFGKLAPQVFVEAGLVKVFYRQALLNWSANTADVQLNTSIPWQIDLVSSGAPCVADLRAIRISALDVNGKASTLELTLPQPTSLVPVRIAGSASTVVVRRPAETALQVRVGRGVASVRIDGQELDTTGGKPYQTPGYAGATRRYDIDVSARLTTVAIETYGEDDLF